MFDGEMHTRIFIASLEQLNINMEQRIWYSGLDNHRKNTLDDEKFLVEILDVPPRGYKTVNEAFAAHLEGANLPVEILYSGGLDSEVVLLSCIMNKIPVVAVTMRLMFRGAPINIADLYYAEKFCREHEIKHAIYDLDIEQFFGNGDHMKYVENYNIQLFVAITLYWLIEQCHSFPVMGGDYLWPQTNVGVLKYSPQRKDYNATDLFMRDNGIPGIGNMISHSLDSNSLFIKEHLKTYPNENFKIEMMRNLGFTQLEQRHRSHGWEIAKALDYDWEKLGFDVYYRLPTYTNIITWNKFLADIIGGDPGTNDEFYRRAHEDLYGEGTYKNNL